MAISKSYNPAGRAYAVVSYHGVPLYRCQVWALELARFHGARICLLSGIRDDAIIRQHNKQFGTNLHGQAWLVEMHRRDPAHYAPANLPKTTSHCGYADGNPFYGRAGTRIAKIKRGIDACDNATARRIVEKLRAIGIPAAQPYHSGSELHHFSLGRQNVNKLRARYARLRIIEARRRRRG